jgi:hypothetical protein
VKPKLTEQTYDGLLPTPHFCCKLHLWVCGFVKVLGNGLLSIGKVLNKPHFFVIFEDISLLLIFALTSFYILLLSN